MTNIVSLMTDLDLSDEIIISTLTKINTICSIYHCSNTFTSCHSFMALGNGDGNGNN
ncbi:MAG: hypothetical protein AB1782_05475 [Cyanobacteriota bacterium]